MSEDDEINITEPEQDHTINIDTNELLTGHDVKPRSVWGTSPHYPTTPCPQCGVRAGGSFYTDEENNKAAARCLNCLTRWMVDPETGEPAGGDS